MPRRRASTTTANAARAATSACARPNCSCEWNHNLSTKDLLYRTAPDNTSRFENQCSPGQSFRLGDIVGDHHASQPLTLHHFLDSRLDLKFGRFIQRRRGFVK